MKRGLIHLSRDVHKYAGKGVWCFASGGFVTNDPPQATCLKCKEIFAYQIRPDPEGRSPIVLKEPYLMLNRKVRSKK